MWPYDLYLHVVYYSNNEEQKKKKKKNQSNYPKPFYCVQMPQGEGFFGGTNIYCRPTDPRVLDICRPTAGFHVNRTTAP
jgi:hypothetical protein